jgi:steroid delta-isomerase-like uncharacterized protein
VTANRDALFHAIERWNAGDLDGYLELYDESIVLHGYSEGPMTKGDVRAYYQALFGSLSDMNLQIHQVVEDSSHVAARFVLTGRHTGELAGMPATGSTVTQHGMTILRFANGRCVERWSVVDFLPVLVQIGAMPPPS